MTLSALEGHFSITESLNMNTVKFKTSWKTFLFYKWYYYPEITFISIDRSCITGRNIGTSRLLLNGRLFSAVTRPFLRIRNCKTNKFVGWAKQELMSNVIHFKNKLISNFYGKKCFKSKREEDRSSEETEVKRKMKQEIWMERKKKSRTELTEKARRKEVRKN